MQDRKQLRLTKVDTLRAQKELLKLIRRKVQNNVGLSIQEEEEYIDLVADALQSQGAYEPTFYEFNNISFPLGSVHSLALNMVDMRGSKIKLTHYSWSCIVNIKEIWYILYKKCIILFPRALEEASHMAKEIPYRESSKGYEFSVKTDTEGTQ